MTVTRRPLKRWKLWMQQSSGSAVTSTTCTEDPLTAVVNNKSRKWNLMTKHSKHPASDSPSVPAVPLDDEVTNCSGDNIPVRLSFNLHGWFQRGRLALIGECTQPAKSRLRGAAVCHNQYTCAITSEDDALLKELKKGGEPWDEIIK
ncbi:hypothetical protein EMCG_01826 [[Emmonsia] crescens]|uniref:Uncharacterized protein n=1 Tax=[Emmonsia] crescens TaxID=73230 RepID=A0A0G2I0H1_9EURO|nr:hypothetical protein EMCG_01826 [Emmonsia crescens UAMH 3008]